jgi:hypothetical protein
MLIVLSLSLAASSDEYKKLEKALERSRHILGYVNQAVRECENYHKLREMQKKLDKRPIDSSSDPSLAEIKVSARSRLSGCKVKVKWV